VDTEREAMLKAVWAARGEARKLFADRVVAVVSGAIESANNLAPAIGDISPTEAYDAWVKDVIALMKGGL
jgi:hypothetical protein